MSYILNKYLKWNKSHAKCFTLIMLALIVKQTCNLSSASKALPIKCLPQSFYRRIQQRFFADQYFDYRQISQLIFNIFSFDKVQLTLDRTNWKWGKRDINILMLAIVYRGIAIPIVWTLLNKRGNSDTKERIALIQRFISIFGKDRIVNVFADREFIGEKWFTWLIENDINFCIRVKNFIVTNHLAKNHKISDLFRHLQVGQTEYRKRRIWVVRVKLYMSALRLEDGELLLVVSPMFNASAIRDYALRWEIETLFSCLKGRGFNLENTRLTDPRRVKKLIAVLAIGFCWCYLTGEWQHDRKKR